MGVFGQLVRQFEQVIRDAGYCQARLFVNGVATQVTVRYLPGGVMEIEGLPGDLPPYLRFQGERVYLDSVGSRPVEDPDAANFYRLYTLWDPRVVVAGLEEERPERQEVEEGRWKARCFPGAALALSEALALRLKDYVRTPQELEFVVQRGRLRQLTAPDPSGSDTMLTLVFAYPDEFFDSLKPLMITSL